MGLTVKKVVQINTKCNGDAFHRLFRYTPQDLRKIAPNHMKNFELQEGEWGIVGSKINWTFIIDGTTHSCKYAIEAADEKDKWITFRIFDGEIMQAFKSFTATVNVAKKGANSLVTWSFEYEKMNETIPDPYAFMDLANKVTNDVNNHQI